MCGLVGVIRLQQQGLFQEHKKIFDDLLIADSLRGSDGTGLISILADGQRLGLKVQGNPYNLIGTKTYEEYTDCHKQPYPVVFAGHNRYATRGGISTKSAHPFYSDGIALMHNGTLRVYNKFPGKFDVDSESFCAAINKMGVDEAIANMDGAYAISYFNAKEKTFNLARNYERPLFLAVNEHTKTIIWASEAEMIRWVLSRRTNDGAQFKIESVPVDTLFSFNIEKFSISDRKLPSTGSKLCPIVTYDYEDYDNTEQAYKKYQKKHFKLKELKKDSLGNQNMVYTTDKTKAFMIGSELIFDMFDNEDVKGNSETTPKDQLRFSVIGLRDDMKGVEFRFTVTGQQRLFELYAQEHLIGTISSIYETKDDKGEPITRVWCKNVRYVGETVK